jgi:multiple sugar transport system permease protein
MSVVVPDQIDRDSPEPVVPWSRPSSLRRLPRRVGKFLVPYAFVAPAVALLGLLGIYTIIYGIELSFVQWNGFSPNWTWVGFANYANVLWDDFMVSPIVRSSAIETLEVLIALPLATVLISLPIAFVLNSAKHLRGFFRTVFFLPYVAAGAAIYYVWQLIYQPTGVLNTVLHDLHLDALVATQGLTGTPRYALAACTAVLVWSGVPIGIVLYLAGLQTIDPEIIDAVRVDGGGRLRTLTAVIWPLLRPITVVVVILEMQQALTNVTIFLIMTNGGPINSTTTLGVEIYGLAFGGGVTGGSNIGYANALAWMLCIVGAVLALIMLRFARRPV